VFTPDYTLLLQVHAAATFYLVGLIWVIQRVHYPLFSHVGSTGFAAYEQLHVRRITPVVGPPMLVEAATAVALVALAPPEAPAGTLWLALLLLAAIWVSTALIQVPCHNALSRQFNEAAHERLVRTNWLRTVLWSVRGLLVLHILASTTRSTG